VALNAVVLSTHINLLRQGLDVISQFRGILLLRRKRTSALFQSRELEGINVFSSTLDGFNEVRGFLVEFWWDWWHRVCGDATGGVEVEERMMIGHVGAILQFRVVADFVDGTLVDATALGVLTSCVLKLGEILTCFRVSCLGDVLAVDICRSVEQSPISVP